MAVGRVRGSAVPAEIGDVDVVVSGEAGDIFVEDGGGAGEAVEEDERGEVWGSGFEVGEAGAVVCVEVVLGCCHGVADNNPQI